MFPQCLLAAPLVSGTAGYMGQFLACSTMVAARTSWCVFLGAPFLGASSLLMREQTGQTCSKPSGETGCSRDLLTSNWTRFAALLCGGEWLQDCPDVELYVTALSLCAVPVLLGRQSGWVGYREAAAHGGGQLNPYSSCCGKTMALDEPFLP